MVSTVSNSDDLLQQTGHRRVSQSLHYHKVCLVGVPNVGKTTLFMRLATGEFVPDVATTLKTDAHRMVREVDNHQIPMVIHDTIDLEKISALSQTYFRAASLVLLVFSVEELSTLQKLDDLAMEARQYAPDNCIFLLIGNKNDLKMDFSNDKPAEYKDALGCQHLYYISAKRGTNVDEMMDRIARLMIGNEFQRDTIALPTLESVRPTLQPRVSLTTEKKTCTSC